MAFARETLSQIQPTHMVTPAAITMTESLFTNSGLYNTNPPFVAIQCGFAHGNSVKQHFYGIREARCIVKVLACIAVQSAWVGRTEFSKIDATK
jgi:hypothetical protein